MEWSRIWEHGGIDSCGRGQWIWLIFICKTVQQFEQENMYVCTSGAHGIKFGDLQYAYIHGDHNYK